MTTTFGPRLGGLQVIPIAVALVVAACSGTGPATTGTSPTPKPPADKITFITDFAAFGYTSPFYGGVDQGFFQDENIDLSITLGQGSADAAAKVGAGTAQFGLADTITSVVAIGKATPIKLVATVWQRYVGGIGYITERRQIRNFKDVEGLKFGAAAGDAYLVVLPELMRQNGADPSKYEVVTMAAANTTAALLAGQIDATPVGAATFASRALGVKAQGFTLGIFLFADNGLDALGHSIIVNNDVLTRNKDLVQRFVRAYAKSMVWSKQPANIDKAVDAYIKVNAQQNRDGEKANYVGTMPFETDSKASGFVGQFVFPTAKAASTVALTNKAYTLSVKPEDVYTNEFVNALPEAYKKGQLP